MAKHSIKYFLAPVLFAVYPVLFYYSNNIGIAAPLSAVILGFSFVVIAGIVYLAGLVTFSKFHPAKISIASTILLFLMLFYGLIFSALRKADFFAVEHFSLLPFLVFITVHLASSVLRQSNKTSLYIWKTVVSLCGVLILFNIAGMMNYGFRLSMPTAEEGPVPAPTVYSPTKQGLPDIYYIIFDEMAGFEVARRYWDYSKIDDFVSFLEKNNFFVAEQSHGSAPSTLNQLATRLNFQVFPFAHESTEHRILEQEAIADNLVMKYLKSYGYTTISFSDLNSDLFFSAMPSMRADIAYENPDELEIHTITSIFDEFSYLALNNTILSPWLEQAAIVQPSIEEHRQMVLFTVENAPRIYSPSPKFVFIYLGIPHLPVLFDQYGRINDPKDYYNWDSYFGQYIYSLQLAKVLIEDILTFADSGQPPVIILQSDHGARNLAGFNNLQGYSEEYKTWIVNAMLLPGCESAPLSQDINPINTFPIVFNCYFDAKIPLQ